MIRTKHLPLLPSYSEWPLIIDDLIVRNKGNLHITTYIFFYDYNQPPAFFYVFLQIITSSNLKMLVNHLSLQTKASLLLVNEIRHILL